MSGKIISITHIGIWAISLVFFIFGYALYAEAKSDRRHTKSENKQTISIYLFDKKANKLLSEKGLIDNKGVVSSKCRVIMKWFDEVENTLIVKTIDGKFFQLGKILSCNIKKDKTSFLLEPLDLNKYFLIEPKLSTDQKIKKPPEILKADNFQDLFQEGLKNQQLKNYSSAIEYYKKALKLKADSPEALINMGTVYFIVGNYNEAIEIYTQALKYLQDKTPDVLNKIGTSYLMLGEYNRAIETYKKILHLDPLNPDVHYSLGLAFFMNGSKEDAFDKYISLKKINTQLAEELFDLLYR